MSEPHDESGFATPERAALSSYPPAANARVVRVKRRGDKRAVVEVETDPEYRYVINVVREGELWYEEDDHN